MKTSINKEAIRAEYAKVWKDEKMIDFCVKKAAASAILPDGGMVIVEKQGIEKSFCFGESGYDYDEAQDMAAHARTSESYFKRENMKHFRSWVKDLTESMNGASNYMLTINKRAYYGQTEDCKLCNINFYRLSDILDACGGSAHISDLPGLELTVRGQKCRIATPEEIGIILKAYKEAEAAHEKKVDSYLKRYGMNHVRTWTYWRDA